MCNARTPIFDLTGRTVYVHYPDRKPLHNFDPCSSPTALDDDPNPRKIELPFSAPQGLCITTLILIKRKHSYPGWKSMSTIKLNAMKILYREIKGTPPHTMLSDEIKEFDDNSQLCSRCQQHGYCKEKYIKDFRTNQLLPIRMDPTTGKYNSFHYTNKPLLKRDICNLVNVRTEIKEASTALGRKLQFAHDLFHQDEFEQASYLYQDILETRCDITEAWRGLLASFYFLGKFREAASLCVSPKLNFDSSFINQFIESCERHAQPTDTIIQSDIALTSNNTQETHQDHRHLAYRFS